MNENSARKVSSEQTVHSQPMLPSWSEAKEQEENTRHSYYKESNVNTHSQFPFLLFVNINPAIKAEIAMTNDMIKRSNLSSSSLNVDVIMTPVTTYLEMSIRYLPKFSFQVPLSFT